MPIAGEQPNLGSPRRVVDLVVALVTQGSYRQARMHLASVELRGGLPEVAEIIGQITAPPAGVDPRTEAQARRNVPDLLPSWLSAPVDEEIGRICGRLAVREPSVTHLIARVLAAAIVDASAPGHEELAGFATRAHVDLRDRVDDVVDISATGAAVGDTERRAPDRSITDWLGRRT